MRLSPKVLLALLAFLLPFIFYVDVFRGRSFGLECATGVMGFRAPYGQEELKDRHYCDELADVGAYAWQHVPQWTKAARSYLKIEIPIWNQNNGIGAPLAANMISAVYFLPNMLFALPQNVFALDLYFVFRMAVASLGMFLFLRSFRFSYPLALTGSLFIFLNGYVTHLPSIVHPNVEMLLPWIAFLIKKSAETRKVGYFAALALVTGFSHLGGFPESSIFLVFFLGLYAAFLTFKAKDKLKVASLFAGSLILSFMLAAILVIPAAEYISLSENTHIGGQLKSVSYQNFLFLPFAKLIGPYLNSRIFEPHLNFEIKNLNYIGTVAVFAMIGSYLALIFLRKRDPHFSFFLLVLGVLLIQYYGIMTIPLFILPGFSNTNIVRFAPFLINFLAVTTGIFGLKYLLKFKPWLTILSASTIGLLSVLAYLVFSSSAKTTGLYDALVVQLILGVSITALITFILLSKRFIKREAILTGLLMAVVATELFIYLPRNGDMARRNSYAKPPAIEYLQARDYKETRIFSPDHILYPDLSALFDLNDIRNIDALWPRVYYGYLKNFVVPDLDDRVLRFAGSTDAPGITAAQVAGNNFFDLLSVKYLLSYQDQNDPQFQKVYDDEMKIYENTRFVPRIHSVREVICAESESEAVSKMRERESTIKDAAIVVSSGCAPKIFDNDVQIQDERFGDKKVTFTYSAEGDSYVILSNTYYPGWKLRINGVEHKIERANFAFEGFKLPPGRDVRATVTYEPLSFKIGAAISAGALALSLFVLMKWRNKTI